MNALANVLFIEKNPEFRWHPGMLLPNTRMQIRSVTPIPFQERHRLTTDVTSFLKDLATLRSPKSPLTFLAYLHSQDRLLPFINRGSFTPTRKEFADYLTWSAGYIENHGIDVQYNEEIVRLADGEDGTVVVVTRDATDGTEYKRKTSMMYFKFNWYISLISDFRESCNFPRGIGQITPSVFSHCAPSPYYSQFYLCAINWGHHLFNQRIFVP